MWLITYLQESPAVFIALTAGLGLMVGSFLNVVIHRLPIMLEQGWHSQCVDLLKLPPETQTALTPTLSPTLSKEPFNLAVPRSRCPHCNHAIRAVENIPILSYIFLGGKCSSCKKPISIRYPLVELTTGLLSAMVAWHFGFNWAAGGALLLTWALVALSVIDYDHQLLPDNITLPFLWLGLTINLNGIYTDISSSVIGALAGYLCLWLLYHLFKAITGKEGMGYGDFKLLALLGAWMGWQMLPLIMLLSSLVGAVVGLSLIVMLGRDRNKPIPFGPYLAAAGWISLLWGDSLTGYYLAITGVG